MLSLCLSGLLALHAGAVPSDVWSDAQRNGEQSRQAIALCRAYARGWLAHADPKTGLLPRNLTADPWWNARDAAADNYPFLALTAAIAGDHHLWQDALRILAQERKLTPRLDSLPDDFIFATQSLREKPSGLPDLIFGAAEYAKDGLLPMTEWLGKGPWLDRMEEMLHDIWKHAPIDSPAGRLASDNVEVCGDLLQAMSRLYWLSGRQEYREWAFRIADHFLVHGNLLEADSLRLRDHGSEIIGGLSEAYVLAARTDAARRDRYRPTIHALLDRILEVGRNEDGFLYNAVNPRTGEVVRGGLSDGWGYVYNAFVTVALIDEMPKYREAAARPLSNLRKYIGYDWSHGSAGVAADEYADSIEGAINLLNRIPVDGGFDWVDSEIQFIFKKQRPDGVIEGWHGDGNSARTSLMYALWKTQGVTAEPWTPDLRLGSVREADGTLRVSVSSEFAWNGTLRFDQARHRVFFNLPLDYPRINQFPEWFTVDDDASYEVSRAGGGSKVVAGRQVRTVKVSLKPGGRYQLSIRKVEQSTTGPAREARLKTGTPDQVRAWQEGLRARLRKLMRLDDLDGGDIPLDVRATGSKPQEGYLLKDVAFNSTPDRRIRALVGVPQGSGLHAAVICIHGHGGDRRVVYDASNVYKGFADALARKGYFTVAVDVGQHAVVESGRTLMGERLWDLMRCVDYLESLPQVDKSRIGCAGLSLGGEMAMWLGAMDQRIVATVSSGFLTMMDQMERDHCMCWKFDGLRELVDFPDVYGLIAPRPLQCQNGRREPANMFTPALAQRAMQELRPVYETFGKPGNVELVIHDGGHEIDLPALLAFFDRHLR